MRPLVVALCVAAVSLIALRAARSLGDTKRYVNDKIGELATSWIVKATPNPFVVTEPWRTTHGRHLRKRDGG